MKTCPINVERLRAAFDYDPETGIFTRKIALAHRTHIGEALRGTLQKGRGYYRLMMDGVDYQVHRLAYAYVHGPIPDGHDVDHINGSKGDNRICNLRLATRSQNTQNRHRLNSNNSSGVCGVSPYRDGFNAYIVVSGKRKHLGNRKTLAEAAALRANAERKLHPFSPINASEATL